VRLFPLPGEISKLIAAVVGTTNIRRIFDFPVRQDVTKASVVDVRYLADVLLGAFGEEAIL
jgi:hypothetical protein